MFMLRLAIARLSASRLPGACDYTWRVGAVRAFGASDRKVADGKLALVLSALHVHDHGANGVIGERLEGQDAKGLLDLDAELLDAEEEGGEEGLDVIPQWQYWQQLPGLLRDGNRFFWVEGRILAKQGRRRFREWYDNRGSQELREPIAASKEDGS